MRKISKKLMLSCIVTLLSLAAFSQNVITGRITDSKDGTPVVGATITVKGTKTMTQTAADGTFKINVTGTAPLVITSVGFDRQEAASSGTVNIKLVQANQQLNEVVVVGYGTQRRRDVTGAISKVSSEKMNSISVPSFEAALQGKAPGVQVLSGNGLAGSGSVIRIRGVNTVSASGDP